MDFATAFKKPFTDVKKLIIGILLSILPIVGFLATGFILEVAKLEMKKKKVLAEWTNWGNLFVKGLISFVISLIYGVPVAIVGFIIAGPAIKDAIAAAALGADPSAVFMGGMSGGIAIVALLGVLVVYIVPSAILSFLSEDKFGAAFNFGTIFKKAFKGQYFVVLIVSMMYSIVLGFVFSFVPYLGPAASGFISGITMFSLLGEIYPHL